MSPSSAADRPPPEAEPVERRAEPNLDGDGDGDGVSGGDDAVATGRAVLAELEALAWWVQQLTALCDLIDSIPPRPARPPIAER